MIAEYYYQKKCGAPLRIFIIISPLIQKLELFFSSYIYTQMCIFLSSFSVPWFFLKQYCRRFSIFFLFWNDAPETSMFPEEHNTKLSTSANETHLKQCRLCELLEDSSSHKLLTLLPETYSVVIIPRYITKVEPFLPVSWSTRISWSYKLL